MGDPRPPADLPGLPPDARSALDLVLGLREGRDGDLRLADFPTEFLHSLATDPPRSTPARIGAAVAVRALREAAAAGTPVRWPGSVDPEDPLLREEGYRLAALATVALTARTGVGLSEEDPENRSALREEPGDAELVAGFKASEREILRRKREPVPYPAADFVADLVELPDRLRRPGRILPPDPEPAVAGPYRFTANHEDRVVKMYDWFRDKYGSPRGERRADLYVAAVAFLGRHRERLEAAGEIAVGPDGALRFRESFLDDLLAHPVAWFEGR